MEKIVDCSHCGGTGTSNRYCCFKSAGGKDDGTPCAGYGESRCCACLGKGVQVLKSWGF
ncbi:MAG: hypothetical protein ABH864_06510 [archaeon]